MERLNLTPELKEAWIKALKSGEYTQIQKNYRDTAAVDGKGFISSGHCCLAVLGNVACELDPESIAPHDVNHGVDILKRSGIDPAFINNLINTNDTFKNFDGKYSNVLPLIEELKI